MYEVNTFAFHCLQTKFWKETGLKGFDVYKYHLQRRPKQGQLVTDRVVFGGVGAPKTHSALATHGLVDRDLSGGKEDVPVSISALYCITSHGMHCAQKATE